MENRMVVLTACLLAACGGSNGGNPTGPGNTTNPPPNAATTAQIQLISTSDPYGYGDTHSFQPGSVAIARGGTVTWINGSGVTHNVTFSTAGAPAHIGNHGTGSSARTFPAAGTFSYSCTNHVGMTGAVTVQ